VLTIKVWGVFFFFVLLGQLRVAGDTLENRFHAYINELPQQKFFVTILSPVHAVLEKLGVDVGRARIDEIRAAPPQPEENAFVSKERVKQLRQSLQERRRVLDDESSPP
jgi:hypothetical protein